MHRELPKPVSFEEARRRVLEEAPALGSERVPLSGARGRVLAEAVVAPLSHPPRDDSAMDGYAVRSSDLLGATRERPARLAVSAEAALPGMAEPPPLRPGEAVRILTGGPVPEGADTVVRQEAAVREAEAVLFWHEHAPGENIRRAGEDFTAGAVLLERGIEVRSGEIAALAALGRTEVAVTRRPRVAIVTSGDELCEPGRALRSGQLYDSNAAALAAMAEEAGAQVGCIGPLPDDLERIRAELAQALAADVIVTAAGISVGDRDFIADALGALGIAWHFRGVRMRPGKAVSFGRVGEKPIFGLPGNPAAALVAFEVLVRPVLRRLAGHPAERPRGLAVLTAPVEKRGGATYFVRGVARAAPGLRFEPLDRQGVGMVSSMIGHNALAVLPPERTAFAAGDRVELWLLEPPPQVRSRMPIVAFVGPSGAGKTTLLVKLCAHLRERGLRIAALKHDAHGFELDREGKDTFRLSRAGAESVAIVGPNGVGALLGESEPEVGGLAARLFPDVDLVLAEGFHAAPCPKVIVLGGREPEARDAIAAADAIAVVGGEILDVPSFAPDDIAGLAEEVVKTFR
jgi:molybdopterin molybdotransferase